MGIQAPRIVFEPTGPDHRTLERTLAKTGLPIVKVNPRQARRFAEATGKLAKTDRLDAALLARMGALLQLEIRAVHDETIADLKQLHIAREALVKDRTAAKNRGKVITIPILKRQNADRLKHIERQILAIEVEIEDRISKDAELNQRFEILTSIPGVGRLTAFVLLIEMPELGSMDRGQVACLSGLAPLARQSGKWIGKAFIRGGRANVRHALYMPALVAMRFNPDLKAKYTQFIATGKPPKLAITAIMRKLIVLANTLLKAGRPWSQKHA